MALTRPAPVMAPAAEAHDCIALFSRMLYGGNALVIHDRCGLSHWGRARTSTPHAPYSVVCNTEKIDHAMMQEVIATPTPHPDLSPTYTLEHAMIMPSSMPMIRDRGVSCGMRSPAYTFSNQWRSISSGVCARDGAATVAVSTWDLPADVRVTRFVRARGVCGRTPGRDKYNLNRGPRVVRLATVRYRLR